VRNLFRRGSPSEPFSPRSNVRVATSGLDGLGSWPHSAGGQLTWPESPSTPAGLGAHSAPREDSMALHSLVRARARRHSPTRLRRRAVVLGALLPVVAAILWTPAAGLVRPDGGAVAATCPSFQALVNAAPVGGTLTVPPCTYNETVTINKRLTVKAAGAVIDGDNVRANGLVVKANDVVVDGLTVTRVKNGAHVGAVHATSVSRFTFKNGVARDSATVCIVLGGGAGFQILNSEFTGCGQEGYFLNNVTDSVFSG